MSTPDPFHALRAALEKATPAPWTREKPGNDVNGWPLGAAVAGTPGRQTIYASPPGGCFPSADADLIVLLRNTAPHLLAALDEARAEVGRLREAARAFVDRVQAVRGEGAMVAGWYREFLALKGALTNS